MTTADANALHAAPPNAAAGASRASGVGTLVAGTVGAMVTCGIVCTLVAVLLNTPNLWRGLLAGGIAGSIATLLSIIPMAFSINRPFNARMVGYAIGSTLRAIVTLAITVLAINVGGYPKWETLAFAAIFYVTLLFAEVAIVSYAARTAGVPAK